MRLLLRGTRQDNKKNPVPDLLCRLKIAFRLSLSSGSSHQLAPSIAAMSAMDGAGLMSVALIGGRVMNDAVRSGLG